jgi:hypothetical protein
VRVQTAFGGKLESKRDLVAWFTTDEARVPVRVDAEFVLGTLRAELADYKGGQRYATGVPAGAGGSGDG